MEETSFTFHFPVKNRKMATSGKRKVKVKLQRLAKIGDFGESEKSTRLLNGN
jgi:hypothetical protein